MRIVSFIHPVRTALPCTGVGRHINNVLLRLATRPGVDLTLLFARQWIGQDGKLDLSMPLRDLPYRVFPTPENLTERAWKLFGMPVMDRFLPNDIDWVYCPMETYLPTRKAKVAITVHDMRHFEPSLPQSTHTHMARHWMRRAFRDCALLFAVSEFTKRRMVDLAGADPAKIVVVGNGIEGEFFAPPPPPATDRPYALVVGGLRRIKGGKHVLEVARELKSRGVPLDIVVAGEPTDSDLRQQAEAMGGFRFLGMIDDPAMRAWLGGASALLFLSRYEGFGIPAVEAMAAGVPVVAANFAALPETIGGGGLLFDPADTQAIANSLDQLRSNLAVREGIVAAGRERAREFTWEATAARVFAGMSRAG